MKRGHSNIDPTKARPWKDTPEKACIPLTGGASFQSSRELPPLALGKDEWEEVGLRMGWLKPTDAKGRVLRIMNLTQGDPELREKCLNRLADEGTTDPKQIKVYDAIITELLERK